MRLGIYHGPLFKGQNGYETYGPYARYLEEFSRHFEELTIFAPVATSETDYRGCLIHAPNVRIVDLPDFRTHIQATWHLPKLYGIFRREIGRVDAINCRNTAPYGYLLYFLGRRRRTPFMYHFTSDPWEVLRVGERYRGLYGRFARMAYRFDFAIQKRVMRRTWSVINGQAVCERLSKITDRMESIVSSTFSQEQIVERTDYQLHQPPRLLYVGYLKHMKGLGHLLDAVKILCGRGKFVELRLVGAGPEERWLRDRASTLQIADRVNFRGYIPMGGSLYAEYDEADLFVFPSLSEGSPRVVLEALARGLPVISTGVGSVPDLIRTGETGLLVPCVDATAIADAISRYISDEALRARCGRAGQAVAREHTLEKFIGTLARRLQQLYRDRNTR